MEQQASIQIEGMNCGHCVAKVQTALTAVAGVTSAQVDLAEKKALVKFDPAAATMGKLMGAVNGAGFRAVGFTK